MESILHQADWQVAALFLAGVLTRITLVLLLCYSVARLLPRYAALRHTVLLAGLLSVLAMPFLCDSLLSLTLPRMSFQLPFEHSAVTSSDSVESSYEPSQVQEPDDYPSSDAKGMPSTVPTGRRSAFVLSLLIATWLIVGFFRTVGLIRSFIHLRHLVKHSSVADFQKLHIFVEEFRRRFRFEREIVVLTSENISNPLAVGVVRNCIVLPPGLTDRLSSTELKAVIFHELAHLQRRDHIVLLLQAIVGTLLWWHPMVLFVNRELTRAREEVCDNYVLQTIDAETYSEALLTISRFLYSATETVGATPLWGSRWNLENRVSSILDERRIVMTSLKLKTSVTVAALCLAISFAFGTVGFSNAAEDEVRPTGTEALKARKSNRVLATRAAADQSVEGRLKRVELMLSELIPIVRKLAKKEARPLVGTYKSAVEGRVTATRAQQGHAYDTSGSVEARLKRIERTIRDLMRHISYVEKKRQGGEAKE